MKLEFLPNEILLIVFDYLNGIDLLRAFYDLNARFSFLLYHQVRFYYFNFLNISKRSFDLICQKHLPFICGQVISLYFSNNICTPEQINLFSYISSLQHFTHLQYLSIDSLRSHHTLLKLLANCQCLNGLTHLMLYSCSFQSLEADFQDIIDKIWSLPKLNTCSIDIKMNDKLFRTPTVISTSLEYVTICNPDLKLTQIDRLVDYTPRLKYLSMFLRGLYDGSSISCVFPTLIQMKIFLFDCNLSMISNLFQSVPNLYRLNINMWSELINGHQWEQLIRNYLPKLKKFRFVMRKILLYEDDTQEIMNNLIDSFQNSFWIDEHKWFVRCFVSPIEICCYTFPSSFNDNTEIYSTLWKSTYPNDNRLKTHNRITGIYHKNFFDLISSDICLTNVLNLYLKFPTKDQFWSIIPNLNNLKTLNVTLQTDTFSSQLQTLLDRASHLHSLRIEQHGPIPQRMCMFKYTSASIRSLDLEKFPVYFSKEECITFTHSPLGIQCEVLHIYVDNREGILTLVTNMHNLRALIVRCADDAPLKKSVVTTDNDEFVSWLKHHLPSTCMIARDSEKNSNVSIWI